MSQAGIVDFEGSHPQVPTIFITDMGTAIPIANTLEILGTIVAAHSIPLETTGSGNVVTIVTQYSSAAGASVGTNAGLASFNSTYFTVDANGFVSLVSSSVATAFTVDASTPPGTNPVVPNGSGVITVTGGQVAAGTTTNVIRTDSLAANTYTIQIQRSQAVGSSTVGDNGVSHFNSTYFTVDSNGFVSLNGGAVGQTITGNSGGALSPTAGNWNILGASTAAGTSPVTTSGSVSTLTVNVQKSQAIAATDATKVGLAAFDSASFTVDANGFVSLIGGGEAIDSIAVQTGTSPIVPTAGGLVTINGAVVAAGTNPVRTDGTGANTMALEIQISQAIAATDATKIGLSNFDSAAFDVDANGFVQLNGGGIAATAFDVQANTAPGTDPVVPSAAGIVTVNGAAVANHSVVLETRSRAANAYNIEVQYATSAASTDATKSGVAHFNSAEFSVDANGFVSILAGGMPWTDVTAATQALSVQNGYITDRSGGVTYTLPATASLGDLIKIDGKLGITTIAQNANQAIRMSSAISATGVTGSVVGTNVGDCITLRCTTAGASTIWIAENFVGNWTVNT